RVPDAQLLRQPGKELARFPDRQVAVAVFALLAVRDVAAEEMAHQLDAVADAEDRHPEFKDRGIGMRGGLGVDALRPAGEDDPDDALLPQLGRGGGIVIDLGVNLTLADAARDDLGELGTEVEDGDGLWHERRERGQQNSGRQKTARWILDSGFAILDF